MKKLLYLFLLLASSCKAQDTLYRTVNGIRIALTQQEVDAQKAEWKSNDSIAQVNLAFDTTFLNIGLRASRITRLRAYLRSQVTSNTTYETVQTTASPFINAYLDGSDRIISWVKGENSAVYGNFTTTGFPSKSYFSVVRQTALLKILQ